MTSKNSTKQKQSSWSTDSKVIPLGAYIHIPWCIRKCPYCDFNSHTAQDNINESLYLDALFADMEAQVQQDERIIETVFIGGGTPSLFSADSIYKILQKLNSCFGLSKSAEVTMEANPGTIEHDSFIAYKEAGINRLSLGIQSFNPQQLKILGRIHDEQQAHAAIEQAMACSFDSVNLDLMHALPSQTPEQAQSDLQLAIKHHPQHISWYQLTIEKNTFFDHQPPELPDEDTIEAIQTHGAELLKSNHYMQYEISAFSKNNQQCRHNLNYWRFGDYLGFGAGAHSKLTRTKPFNVQRSSRCKHPQQYMQLAGSKESVQQQSITDAAELIFEFLMNQLRLSEVVKKTVFCQRTGLAWEQLKQAAQEAIAQNLIQLDDRQLGLTSHGRLFLNNTLLTFLPANR